MRVVRLFDILFSYLLVLVCAAGLVAGLFDVRFFAVSGAALVIYLIWGFFRLRCPWCGETVDLNKLLRGYKRTCNCPNCGHEITVALFVKKKPPKKLRYARRYAKRGAMPAQRHDAEALPAQPLEPIEENAGAEDIEAPEPPEDVAADGIPEDRGPESGADVPIDGAERQEEADPEPFSGENNENEGSKRE